MMWIPCILIECSVFHAAWRNGTLLNAGYFMQHDWMLWIPAELLNAVDFLQHVPKHLWFNAVDSMQRHWMLRIPFIVAKWITIVCSGVHAARPNASRLNAVDFIQHGPNIPIECRGFHAVWLNAVESMPRGPMHPDWMQWIPCSVVKCILIERSVYHAAWLKGSPLNAVDTMQRGAMDSDWMQWIPCIEAQSIPIECSEIDARWLNAVYFMHPGKMHPVWMQWIPCSWIECSGFHAAL